MQTSLLDYAKLLSVAQAVVTDGALVVQAHGTREQLHVEGAQQGCRCQKALDFCHKKVSLNDVAEQDVAVHIPRNNFEGRV